MFVLLVCREHWKLVLNYEMLYYIHLISNTKIDKNVFLPLTSRVVTPVHTRWFRRFRRCRSVWFPRRRKWWRRSYSSRRRKSCIWSWSTSWHASPDPRWPSSSPSTNRRSRRRPSKWRSGAAAAFVAFLNGSLLKVLWYTSHGSDCVFFWIIFYSFLCSLWHPS